MQTEPLPAPTQRDWAVALAKRGFPVHPLKENSKVPIGRDWQARATSDPDKAWLLWSDPDTGDALPLNVGFKSGVDGLLVIDVDVKNGAPGLAMLAAAEVELGPLPAGLRIRTPSGGLHIPLRLPPGVSVGNRPLATGIDIRGENGNVATVGSILDGVAYSLIGDARDVPDAPVAWVEHFLSLQTRRVDRTGPRLPIGDLDTEEDIANATTYLRRCAPAVEGVRGDDRTIAVASEVGDRGISEATALALMLEHWNPRCSPPWEPDDLRRKIESAYKSRQNDLGCESAAARRARCHSDLDDMSVAEAVDGAGAPKRQWPEPEDLWQDDQGGELPDLADEVMPPALAAWCADEAKRKGVPLGAVAVPALVAFEAALSSRFRVRVRQHDLTYEERPILWGALVGGPGSRKTPVLKEAVRPLEAAQSEWSRQFQGQLRAYEARTAAAKRVRGAPEVAVGPRPVERVKLIHDATAESVVIVEAENPNGLLMFRDELSGWAGSMDAYSGGKGAASKDAPFWLEAKSGAPYRVRRVGREAVSAEVHAVHVLGGIQPDVVRKLARGGDWTGNGMFQRFLLAHLPDAVRPPDLAPDLAVRSVVFDAIRHILTLEPNDFTEPFRFEPTADRHRGALLDLQAAWLLRPDFSDPFKGWISKLEGEWARIALVLHFAEWATGAGALLDDFPPEVISDATAERAFRFLVEFQFPQQRRFYQRVAGANAGQDERALQVAGHILARRLTELSDRDFQRNLKHGFGGRANEALRREVMDLLETSGWVAAGPEDRRGKVIRWSINPRLHDGRFAERAEQERTARDAALAAIRGAAASARGE